MTTTPGLLGPHLRAFFVEYLGNQKRASPHTIASCRDTFRLLLTFLHEKTGRTPSALRVCDLQPPLILQVLEQLEHQRGNTVRSRNIRLSAIRSLFRVITFRDPTSIVQATQVISFAVFVRECHAKIASSKIVDCIVQRFSWRTLSWRHLSCHPLGSLSWAYFKDSSRPPRGKLSCC